MPPRRAVVFLAMLAALVVAPSSVFAVAPNKLLSPGITPSSGTTATLFELSVTYSSAAGNPANGVTATVAGKVVGLWLTSGIPVDGTWTGSTTLPAGSWMVVFQADASKGADPTATIGPISVSPGVTQPPSIPGTDQPSTDTPEPGGTGSSPEPRPQPSAAARSSGSAAPAAGTAKPSGGAAAAASDAASPTDQGHKEAPRRRSPAAGASSSADGGAAPAAQPTATASTAGAQAVGQELVDMVLLFGIAGVAGVALLGAAWIIIASRRDQEEPSLVVIASVDPAIPVIPTVEQRAMRRARLRPSDDPILAALGLNDEEPLPPEQGDQGANTRRYRRAARNPRPDR